MTSSHVTTISNTTQHWVGEYEVKSTGENLDYALFMVRLKIAVESLYLDLSSDLKIGPAQWAKSPKKSEGVYF